MVSRHTYCRDEHAAATMTAPKASAHGAMRPSLHSSWNHFAKLPAHFRKYLFGPKRLSACQTRLVYRQRFSWLTGARTFQCKRSRVSAHRASRCSPPQQPAASPRNCWRRHSSRVFRPEEARVTRVGRRFSGKEEIPNCDLSRTSAGSVVPSRWC